MWCIGCTAYLCSICAQQREPAVYTNLCSGSQSRGFSNISICICLSLHFINHMSCTLSFSLNCFEAYLSYLAMVSVLHWKYSEYLCPLQVAKQLQNDDKKATHVVRSCAYCPYTMHICVQWTYVNIHMLEKIRHSTH